MIGLFDKKDIQLIGISGKAGVGKDFIAKNIFTDFFKISLADHFKNDVVGKKIHTFEEVFITKPIEVRENLQIIGTEKGRMVYGDDVWINCIEAWMYSIYMKNGITKFCIPDIRFDNEAEWIHDMGGIVYRVISDRVHNNMNSSTLEHISESGINGNLVDKTIFNNKGVSIEELRSQL